MRYAKGTKVRIAWTDKCGRTQFAIRWWNQVDAFIAKHQVNGNHDFRVKGRGWKKWQGVVPVWCVDCGEDVIDMGEYCAVHDDVWLKATPDGAGMLCVGCIENRLGRLLTPADFDTDASCNYGRFKSERLRSRTGR